MTDSQTQASEHPEPFDREPGAGQKPVEFKSISKMAWAIWGISGSIPIVLITGPLAALSVIAYSEVGFLVLVLTVALLGWWFWIAWRRWKAWGYAEFERDLHIKKGVLVRRLTIVPYGRMQFVDVRQGPFERAFGLSTVKLHTAAAATDAEIPYLPANEAERLRTRLTELGEAHAAGI
jgi:uncharacterized protein